MADSGRPRQISANQKRALAALLAEPTVKAAAERAGLGERTVYRYLNDPDFRAELRQYQGAMIAAAAASLAGMSADARAALHGVLQDPEATHAVIVRAATVIHQEWRRSAELDDLAQQVQEIKAMLAESVGLGTQADSDGGG